MKKILFALLLACSFIAKAQVIPFMGIAPTLSTSDSVLWNFSDAALSYTNARNISGDPNLGVRTLLVAQILAVWVF